jgi:hypothetical protein
MLSLALAAVRKGCEGGIPSDCGPDDLAVYNGRDMREREPRVHDKDTLCQFQRPADIRMPRNQTRSFDQPHSTNLDGTSRPTIRMKLKFLKNHLIVRSL